MRVAITGGKGGTGKSIVAISLAVEFAHKEENMPLFISRYPNGT